MQPSPYNKRIKCPNINIDQCPPRTKPIYIDVDIDISQFGVTCPCKGKVSSTACNGKPVLTG